MAEIENKKESPKGELKLLVLLLIMGLGWFIESLKVPGAFQGVSNGPGSIAQLVALAFILMVIGQGVTLVKSGYREGTWKDVKSYLFDSQVVLMLIGLLLYGLLVEHLTFVPTSIIFLTIMMYLLERKEPVKKFVVACVFVGALYLIFSSVFQIVLP